MARVRFVIAALALLAAALVPARTAEAATPLPAHVFAPYYEAWLGDSLSSLAQASGTRYYTMAFIEAPSQDQCQPTWNGDPSMGMDSGAFADDIARLRALGGDVVPSFGGYSADHGGTEIAETCHSPAELAAAYESVITAYDVTRLDMDVEVDALNRTFSINRRNKAIKLVEDWAEGVAALTGLSSINRRNKAIKLVEDWAEAQGRPLQIEYTLPVEPPGLEPNGLYVLQNAIANGARVDVVNIMTFDYYDGVTSDMGHAAIEAARNLHRQLAQLYPSKSSKALWAMEGNTILPGIDDYGPPEVTYQKDAQRLLRFAQTKGISTISTWAAQRDNGGCPGTLDSDSCSGLVQDDWAFAHILNAFTGS